MKYTATWYTQAAILFLFYTLLFYTLQLHLFFKFFLQILFMITTIIDNKNEINNHFLACC